MLATEIDTHKDIVLRLASEHGIEPSVWIGKENLIPFVQAHFPNCTILDKNQLVGGAWKNGHKLSISDMEEIASYWDSDEFRDQRVNLLEEFNRYPSPDNFRALDREVLLRLLQMQIFAAIKQQAPNFLFALNTPHNPVNLSAFFLAKWLNIPTLFFSSSGTLAPSPIPSTDLGVFDIEGRIIPEPESEAETSAVDFNAKSARKALSEMSTGEEIHWQAYERELLQKHAPRKFQRQRDIRNKIKRSLLRLRSPEEALFADMLDRNYTRLAEAHDQAPAKTDLAEHGLLTLHFQPEASAVPMGLGDTFQGEFVLRARKLLPPDITLVVKEHPSQLKTSMEGSFGRSPRFYDFVNSIPNTKIISAFAQTKDLLDTARVVFTLTGSIGIEAAIRSIPVVYFGAAWWGGMPGTFNGRDPNLIEKLSAYIPPSFDSVSDYIVDFIQYSAIPGFADSGTREYWNKRSTPPEGFQDSLITRLVRTVTRFAGGINDG